MSGSNGRISSPRGRNRERDEFLPPIPERSNSTTGRHSAVLRSGSAVDTKDVRSAIKADFRMSLRRAIGGGDIESRDDDAVNPPISYPTTTATATTGNIRATTTSSSFALSSPPVAVVTTTGTASDDASHMTAQKPIKELVFRVESKLGLPPPPPTLSSTLVHLDSASVTSTIQTTASRRTSASRHTTASRHTMASRHSTRRCATTSLLASPAAFAEGVESRSMAVQTELPVPTAPKAAALSVLSVGIAEPVAPIARLVVNPPFAVSAAVSASVESEPTALHSPMSHGSTSIGRTFKRLSASVEPTVTDGAATRIVVEHALPGVLDAASLKIQATESNHESRRSKSECRTDVSMTEDNPADEISATPTVNNTSRKHLKAALISPLYSRPVDAKARNAKYTADRSMEDVLPTRCAGDELLNLALLCEPEFDPPEITSIPTDEIVDAVNELTDDHNSRSFDEHMIEIAARDTRDQYQLGRLQARINRRRQILSPESQKQYAPSFKTLRSSRIKTTRTIFNQNQSHNEHVSSTYSGANSLVADNTISSTPELAINTSSTIQSLQRGNTIGPSMTSSSSGYKSESGITHTSSGMPSTLCDTAQRGKLFAKMIHLMNDVSPDGNPDDSPSQVMVMHANGASCFSIAELKLIEKCTEDEMTRILHEFEQSNSLVASSPAKNDINGSPELGIPDFGIPEFDEEYEQQSSPTDELHIIPEFTYQNNVTSITTKLSDVTSPPFHEGFEEDEIILLQQSLKVTSPPTSPVGQSLKVKVPSSPYPSPPTSPSPFAADVASIAAPRTFGPKRSNPDDRLEYEPYHPDSTPLSPVAVAAAEAAAAEAAAAVAVSEAAMYAAFQMRRREELAAEAAEAKATIQKLEREELLTEETAKTNAAEVQRLEKEAFLAELAHTKAVDVQRLERDELAEEAAITNATELKREESAAKAAKAKAEELQKRKREELAVEAALANATADLQRINGEELEAEAAKVIAAKAKSAELQTLEREELEVEAAKSKSAEEMSNAKSVAEKGLLAQTDNIPEIIKLNDVQYDAANNGRVEQTLVVEVEEAIDEEKNLKQSPVTTWKLLAMNRKKVKFRGAKKEFFHDEEWDDGFDELREVTSILSHREDELMKAKEGLHKAKTEEEAVINNVNQPLFVVNFDVKSESLLEDEIAIPLKDQPNQRCGCGFLSIY